MSEPFLIRNSETKVEYELSDVAYFISEYKPRGFEIVEHPPAGYVVPEMPKPKIAKAKATTDMIEFTPTFDAIAVIGGPEES